MKLFPVFPIYSPFQDTSFIKTLFTRGVSLMRLHDISSAALQASQTVLCPANFTSFHRHLGTICRTPQNSKDFFPSIYPREAEDTKSFPVQIFSRLSGTSTVGQRLKGQVRAADMLGFSCDQLSLHQSSSRNSLVLQ